MKPALVGILSLIFWTAVVGCGGNPGVDTTSQTSDLQPATTQTDTQIKVPPSPSASPFGFHPAKTKVPGYPDNGYGDAMNIGVRWTRAELYVFWFIAQKELQSNVYDFSKYDQMWSEVPSGIKILANIAPQGPIDEGHGQPGSFLPVDETSYRAFVVAAVERYDGDGVDDMPGLQNPITFWQVGNEPDNRRRKDFAALQRITYETVKQVCPDCQVLIGGVPGQPAGYIAAFDESYAPILRELGGKYVDIFDFHWYGEATGDYQLKDAATGEDALEHMKKELTADGFAADLPIWITEMGSYSGAPKASRAGAGFQAQTERQQAADYFKRFIYPLSRGVEKIFTAFGVIDGFKHEDGYFDHTGLIYGANDPGGLGMGVKKLSYYTYKKMTDSLAGADWSTIETLRDGGSDNIYLFRVEINGKPVYIAWWDYFDEAGYTPGATRSISISDVPSGQLQVSAVVPSAAAGSDVKDYATAFPVTIVSNTDGQATVQLGEDPVIVTTA